MRSKRKKAGRRVILCLLACLVLLSGCANGEETSERDAAAAVSGTENATLAEIARQLSQMQSQLDAVGAQYRELQEKMDKIVQGEERPNDITGEVSQPLPPETQGSHLYTYQTGADGIVLTEYLGDAREVIVPGAIDGMRVVGLADSVFAGKAVRSVVLPDTIRTLGWFTFYGCASLEQVSIPASVESIGYASFDGCSSSLTLTVADGSYAQKYAASFALRYVIQ